MPGLSMSALSLQYVQVPVRALSAGLPYNPTGDTVQMAFIVGFGEPQNTDWKSASWASTSTVNGYYLAQCLIGPGGTEQLAQGTYATWVKITDNPEIPVINTGTLTITP